MYMLGNNLVAFSYRLYSRNESLTELKMLLVIHFSLFFFYSDQEKQGSSTPMKETKRRSQLLLTIEKVMSYVWVMDDNTFNFIYDKILSHD